MIFFAELQMQGEKHLNVNSGVLEILAKTYPEQNICVYSDDLHAKYLKLKVDKLSNITFESYKYTGEKELKKKYTLSKIFREAYSSIKLFKLGKNKNIKLIVFASAFPFTAILLNILSSIFRIKILICLHGDIGVLKLNRIKPTTIFFKAAIKYFLYNRKKGVSLIIFGESIKSELIRFLPKMKKHDILCIDHPYDYNDKFEKRLKVISNTFVFANIGAGILNKNSHFIFKLAQNFKKEIALKEINFKIVGKISPQVLSYDNGLVSINTSSQFITFKEFENEIIIADYFIYFFTHNSIYDLCPSGTFFDAIKYEKPIIALKNPFFEYYFDRLGNIGYLCEDIDEMTLAIRKIIAGENHLPEQIKNLQAAKNTLSIDTIASSFKNQLEGLTNEQ